MANCLLLIFNCLLPSIPHYPLPIPKNMTYLTRLFGLTLSLFLIGSCSSLLPLALAETSPSVTEDSSRGQILPITATVVLGGETIKLEVAETPEEQAMGLMYRTSLADDRGMLFPFNPPRPVRFCPPFPKLHHTVFYLD